MNFLAKLLFLEVKVDEEFQDKSLVKYLKNTF